MNDDIERIRKLLDTENAEMTAREIGTRLGIDLARASRLLYNQVKQERLACRFRNGKVYFYPMKGPASVRHIVADETAKKYEHYRSTKTVGNRNYTCTHTDMLRILASQGNEKAKEELLRRQEVRA